MSPMFDCFFVENAVCSNMTPTLTTVTAGYFDRILVGFASWQVVAKSGSARGPPAAKKQKIDKFSATGKYSTTLGFGRRTKGSLLARFSPLLSPVV